MNLIEIMVVIVLIGLITAAIGTGIFIQLRNGQDRIARQQLAPLCSGFELFRLQYGAYPPTSEGISAVTKPARGRPLLEKAPLDPWQRPFRYAFPGVHGGAIDVWSAGEDGVDGSDDDVGNW